MIQLFFLVSLAMFYLCSCPYTKVEESFNLQVGTVGELVDWMIDSLIRWLVWLDRGIDQ